MIKTSNLEFRSPNLLSTKAILDSALSTLTEFCSSRVYFQRSDAIHKIHIVLTPNSHYGNDKSEISLHVLENHGEIIYNVVKNPSESLRALRCL